MNYYMAALAAVLILWYSIGHTQDAPQYNPFKLGIVTLDDGTLLAVCAPVPAQPKPQKRESF